MEAEAGETAPGRRRAAQIRNTKQIRITGKRGKMKKTGPELILPRLSFPPFFPFPPFGFVLIFGF
jgi:hypothetical protein